MKSLILVFIFALVCSCNSYKILVCYPLGVQSLNLLGQAVVKHLLNDGHEVTFITTFPTKKPPTKNFREIDISHNIKVIEDDPQGSIRYILENQVKEGKISEFQEVCKETAKHTLQNENVKKLLEDNNEHFDAIIVDLFESEIYAGLSVLYNCPMIWVHSLGAQWHVIRLIGEPSSPSYDTAYYASHVHPFSIIDRIQELWSRIEWQFFKTFVILPEERDIYEQTFGPLLAKRGRELPDYEKVIYNASFIFGNEHNAISYRPSTPQNYKDIGGFHIDDLVKPLPKNLQELMDNAAHGVIYFSMGSLFKSKDMPVEIISGLLKVFGELKETVIWKYEDNLKDVPKNVHIVQWAPQQSILAHPNCKFFITHGGLLSSIETVYFGVPIIGIPILMDQFVNTKKAVANGYAIIVDLNYNLPQNLKAAINEMQNNKALKTRVKELSAIYHDRLTKPGSELAHWVGHVIRTGGARHMRSPAVDVPLYQKLYLDLLGLIFGILFILYALLKMAFKKNNENIVKKKKK